MGHFVLAAAIVGTALQVESDRAATRAQQVELRMAKRQESAAARDRELQRKRRTGAILGTQSALAAASGVAMSGSVANVSLTDAKRAGEETMIDDANTRARIGALERRRRTIGRLGNIRTATTILGFAEQGARRGDFSRGGGGP